MEPPSNNAGGNVQNVTTSFPSANSISQETQKVNVPVGNLTQTAPRIYRNGSPLFAGMDEAELTREIAREGRISQDMIGMSIDYE